MPVYYVRLTLYVINAARQQVMADLSHAEIHGTSGKYTVNLVYKDSKNSLYHYPLDKNTVFTTIDSAVTALTTKTDTQYSDGRATSENHFSCGWIKIYRKRSCNLYHIAV